MELAGFVEKPSRLKKEPKPRLVHGCNDAAEAAAEDPELMGTDADGETVQ